MACSALVLLQLLVSRSSGLLVAVSSCVSTKVAAVYALRALAKHRLDAQAVAKCADAYIKGLSDATEMIAARISKRRVSRDLPLSHLQLGR
eukprot:5952875-Amphidinium_carterae.1